MLKSHWFPIELGPRIHQARDMLQVQSRTIGVFVYSVRVRSCTSLKQEGGEGGILRWNIDLGRSGVTTFTYFRIHQAFRKQVVAVFSIIALK
ncbi:hypothetical protein VNO77_17969 [Canavalia gladiata]|uniref:Uncharacterized protein n=1 Tax=Canavalia gladiata TaxID=3824 RepID=A0AAN9QN74_CANGL